MSPAGFLAVSGRPKAARTNGRTNSRGQKAIGVRPAAAAGKNRNHTPAGYIPAQKRSRKYRCSIFGSIRPPKGGQDDFLAAATAKTLFSPAAEAEFQNSASKGTIGGG